MSLKINTCLSLFTPVKYCFLLITSLLLCQMTDVMGEPSSGDQEPFFNAQGVPCGYEEFIGYAIDDASSYFARLCEDHGSFIRRPINILTVMADIGRPEALDFTLKIDTGYARKEDAVFDGVLKELQIVKMIELVSRECREIPPKARVEGRPTTIEFNFYSLTVGAYQRIPDLAQIAKLRQGINKVPVEEFGDAPLRWTSPLHQLKFS
jgi:hypothetical protein